MKKISVIIPVRLNSERLKKKILKKIGDYTVIGILLKRLQYLPLNIDIIFSISKDKSSLRLIKFCKLKKLKFYVGSKNNVALRVLNTANKFKVTDIIRINGDSPLTDLKSILTFLKKYQLCKCDLLTNIFPRSFPKGMSIEIFKKKILEKNIRKFDKKNKEHVTSFFYQNKNKFKIKNIKSRYNYSKFSFAIDERKDIFLLKKIISHPKFTFNSKLEDIIEISLLKK
jgi:spore coat polysaccharide biosynthesis protein SpsF (cytidylyltransferase family)